MSTRLTDYKIALARGLAGRVEQKHICGQKKLQTKYEEAWDKSGNYVWPYSAGQIEIWSSGSEDTLSGSGIQAVRLHGLDSDWNYQSEVVNLSGTGIVCSVNDYIRLNNAESVSLGKFPTTVTGNGFGGITFARCDAGAHHGYISYSSGVSLGVMCNGRYSVPNNKIALITSLTINIESGKNADVLLAHRENANNTSTYYPWHVDHQFKQLNGVFTHELAVPLALKSFTDFTIITEGSAANNVISISIDMLEYNVR